MALIPRAAPQIEDVNPLPNARPEYRVSSGPNIQAAAFAGSDAIGEIGQKYRDRTDAAAYMEAQRKLSDWSNHWNDPNNADGVTKYKGREALKLGDAMLPDFDRTVGEIAAKLPSERARQKFLEHAQLERDQTYGQINRYATTENDAFMAAERTAFVETRRNDLVRAKLSDPNRFAQLQASTEETIYAEAAANGRPANETALQIAKLRSDVHVGALEQLMTSDPLAAQLYVDEHRDELLPDSLAAVERTLHPLVEDAQAEEDSELALQGLDLEGPTSRDRSTVQADYKGLSEKHGLPISSTVRSKAKNNAVDGVSNSQHLAENGGTAADFDVAGVPVAKVEAFIADARRAGYEVVDERNRKGHKPHIHLELPPGAKGPTGGGAGGAGGMVAGMAQTEGDAIERVQGIANPTRRKAAEQRIRQKWSQMQQDRQETERKAAEEINLAVWAADPKADLRTILGPQAYAFAASKGMLRSLSEDLKWRREGGVQADVPEVVGTYLETLRRNPQAFAAMDVAKNGRHMSPETRERLLKAQLDVRSGKDPAGFEDFAPETAQLDALVFGPLKIQFGTEKAGDKQAEVMRAKFESAYYAVKQQWAAANPGKKPNAEQREAMIRRLTADFVLSGKHVPFYQAGSKGAVPPDAAAAIRAEGRKRGKATMTDDEVRHVYLVGVGQ